MSALFHPNLCGHIAAEWLIDMKIWKPSLCASWVHINETIYVVDERTDEMLFFREDAVHLSKCIEQGMSTEEITEQIASPEQFEENRATIIDTLDDLKERGIIEEVEVC